MPRAIVCPFCREYLEDASALEAGPIACPACAESISASQVAQQTPELVAAARTAREKRGALANHPSSGASLEQAQQMMDVVGGVNLRWKDNLIQAIVILACIPLGSLIGVAIADQTADGVMFGGFAGLLVGLFGSGFVLGVFRFITGIRTLKKK
jgi:hypothetical protein